MDLTSLLRMFGSLGLVLGLLWSALWLVRRFDLRLPGSVAGARSLGRIELVERTALDQRRSLVLLRRDGREHLILLAPEGSTVIEAGIRCDEADLLVQRERQAAEAERRAAQEAAVRAAQAALQERTRAGLQRAADFTRRVRTQLRRRQTFAELIEHGTADPIQARTGRTTKRRSRRRRAKAA